MEITRILAETGITWTQIKKMALNRKKWRNTITSTSKVEEAMG